MTDIDHAALAFAVAAGWLFLSDRSTSAVWKAFGLIAAVGWALISLSYTLTAAAGLIQ